MTMIVGLLLTHRFVYDWFIFAIGNG